MKGRCEWKTGSGESYEILDNKTKVILGTKDKGQKPFTAILCFASDSDMNEYVKENPDCYENILSKAKLQILLERYAYSEISGTFILI